MTFAGTMDGSGWNRRVTPQQSDRTIPTPQRQAYLSPSGRGLREHARVQKLLADAEAEKVREQQQRRKQQEQREAAHNAQVQFEAMQTLLEQTIAMHGLTETESQFVWDTMLEQKRFDLEICEMLCQEIKARRVATVRRGIARIAAVKAQCSERTWQVILENIRGSSQPQFKDGWTQSEIESGEAHERTFASLTRKRT